jgi:fucose permease
VRPSLLTGVAHAAFAVYGASVVSMGPALPSIARSFGLSLGEAGTVFAVAGLGFLLVVFLDAHRRTPALNLLHSFFGWGALVGPLYAGVVVELAGWRWVFVGLAVAIIALVPIALAQRFPHPSATERVRWGQVPELLHSRLVQLGTLGILLYVAAELSLSAWSFPLLEARSYPTLVASLGTSVFWAGIALGRWACTWLSAHLRPARLVQAGAGLCAAGAIGLLVPSTSALAVAALTIAGLGAAPIYPTIMSLACARFPRMTGTVTGLITTATAAGTLLGPATVGRLGDALGLERALLAVVVAALLIVGLYQLPTAEGDDSQDRQDKADTQDG